MFMIDIITYSEGWHYGASTDVVGRLIEAISGQELEICISTLK